MDKGYSLKEVIWKYLTLPYAFLLWVLTRDLEEDEEADKKDGK